MLMSKSFAARPTNVSHCREVFDSLLNYVLCDSNADDPCLKPRYKAFKGI